MALLGDDHGDYVGLGKWRYFDGKKDKAQAMQSGTWTRTAVGTTFHVPGFADTPGSPNDRSFAHATENMSGWVREANEPARSTASLRKQPDINYQVFVPITSVAAGAGSVTLTFAGGLFESGERRHALPAFRAAGDVARDEIGRRAGERLQSQGERYSMVASTDGGLLNSSFLADFFVAA